MTFNEGLFFDVVHKISLFFLPLSTCVVAVVMTMVLMTKHQGVTIQKVDRNSFELVHIM